MKYNEIEGDLIQLALKGKFDVIGHGTNCFCTQRNGIAPLMVKAFGTNTFEMENNIHKGDINKLGTIDYRQLVIKDGKVEDWDYTGKQQELFVINCYSQYNYSATTKPLDYEALTLCMRKINHIFKGKHIGLPTIGCGLAGGIWDKSKLDMHDQIIFERRFNKDVKTIIQDELKDCDVTIVHFKP